MPGLAALQASVGDGALRRGEVTQVADDGKEERKLGVSLSPLVDSSGRNVGRIMNFQDLTELREMEAAMQRAERLAAVGRLAAGIAHEIRNPLAAISGSIELLSQTMQADAPSTSARRASERGTSAAAGAEDARENNELMGIVLREVERLNGLITELLEFARPRTLETQRSTWRRRWPRCSRYSRTTSGSATRRSSCDADEPLLVDADPAQLRQVVWNLLRNAAEAAPGQQIAVDRARRRRLRAAHLPRSRAGHRAEHRARIFEPFFSTKEGGTGLGLATVHRIVDEHKGAVELDCPADGGTVVTIKLPSARAIASATVKRVSAQEIVERGRVDQLAGDAAEEDGVAVGHRRRLVRSAARVR